jgi:SAM-dependent methyltransferase
MKQRISDVTQTAAIKPLACPDCGRSLRADGEDLLCRLRHRFMAIDGYYDLWPTDEPQPAVDWFATPYGVVYDAAIKERWLARLGGRLGWGADIGRVFEMMDEGVKCEPGQVILDVPVGGAPPLRSAPGRLQGSYVGIDVSPEMLRRAVRERAADGLENVVLARADAMRLPLRDGVVDRVLCFNGLHVLPDKRTAMREIYRVLKPGGQLWGNVVIADATLGGIMTRPWFSRSWLFFHPADPDELEELAINSGFTTWQQDVQGSMLFFRGEREKS